MSAALDAMKATFKAEEEAIQKQKNGASNTEWYPFWKMDFDETAIVRFLPDTNPSNPHFVIEKWMHKLDIEIDGKTQRRHVPCLKMYDEKCPICEQSQKFYNDNDDDNGSLFWRKKSYVAQILVQDTPFDLDPEDDGSVKIHKLINLETKIYEKIKKAIMQGDLDEVPTDFDNGYDFRLNKTKDGKWASFSTSSFRPKPTKVSSKLLDGVELYDLKLKLPRKPEVAYLEAVLHAALTGEPFEYRQDNKSSDSSPSAAVVSKSVVSEKEEHTEVEDTEEAETQSVMDIINSRRNKK